MRVLGIGSAVLKDKSIPGQCLLQILGPLPSSELLSMPIENLTVPGKWGWAGRQLLFLKVPRHLCAPRRRVYPGSGWYGSAPLKKSLREECTYLSECFPPRLPPDRKPLPSMESARGPRQWPKPYSLRSKPKCCRGGTRPWVSSPLPSLGQEDEKSCSQRRGGAPSCGPEGLSGTTGVKSIDQKPGAELIRPDPDQR